MGFFAIFFYGGISLPYRAIGHFGIFWGVEILPPQKSTHCLRTELRAYWYFVGGISLPSRALGHFGFFWGSRFCFPPRRVPRAYRRLLRAYRYFAVKFHYLPWPLGTLDFVSKNIFFQKIFFFPEFFFLEKNSKTNFPDGSS